MSITAAQRFTRSHPCSVCHGYDEAPRRHGVRCAGFLSDDGAWCHCTREEHAGGLTMNMKTYPPTYAHYLTGQCKCGATHDGAVSPVSVEGLESSRRRSRSSPPEPVGTLDRCYVYTDEWGVPRHRTVRFREPKSFRQQRYANGEWLWGLGDVNPYLYRLPDVLAAPVSQPVWWTEGEKDADGLANVGLVSTSSPNGSKTWYTHFGQWLAGRYVVLVEDNDQDGRWRVGRLRRPLVDVAASVRVVSFPDLPEGGDVTDWLAGGGTANELLSMIGTPHKEAIRV